MIEKFSIRLRRLRMQNDLSVKQVANELSIAPSTYREWENGRSIRGEPYVQLAQVFNIEVSELMTGVKSQSLDIKDLNVLQTLCSSIVAQIVKMKRDSN
jgi:transcriptional regulator with XRE-family HTH domain